MRQSQNFTESKRMQLYPVNGTENKISRYPGIWTCLYTLIYHSTESLLIKHALHVINVITDATKFVIKSCVSRLDFMVP